MQQDGNALWDVPQTPGWNLPSLKSYSINRRTGFRGKRSLWNSLEN